MIRRLSPWSVARALLLGAAALTVTLPMLWVALASFKSPAQLNDPGLVIFNPNLANWARVLEAGILESAGRSAMVAAVTVAISVVAGSMGAYAISAYKAGGSATRFGILAAQVLPPAL
jgi:ABC-type glycerol-3-phosphate transport system permease component